MSAKKLLDRKALQSALGLHGFTGWLTSGVLYRLLELGRLNRRYKGISDLEGPAFSSAVLRVMGISFELPPEQLDNIPLEGGFFTVSNHHYGGAILGFGKCFLQDKAQQNVGIYGGQ